MGFLSLRFTLTLRRSPARPWSHPAPHTHSSDPSDPGSHSGLGSLTHTLPVTDTQSPCVSRSAGVTAQWPDHTFALAGPPQAPCHPQSRADTVQTPIRPPRAADAPRRRRPVPHLVPVSVQVCRAGGVSGARRLLKQQVAPLLQQRARPCLQSWPQDAQVPGQGAQRRAGVGARRLRDGTRGLGARVAASAAPPNFLRDAGGSGRRSRPHPSGPAAG